MHSSLLESNAMLMSTCVVIQVRRREHTRECSIECIQRPIKLHSQICNLSAPRSDPAQTTAQIDNPRGCQHMLYQHYVKAKQSCAA